MGTFDRRTFLTVSATTGLSAAAVAVLAACGGDNGGGGGGNGGGGGGGGGGAAQWWEAGQPQVALDEKLVEDNKAALGEVQVTYYSNTKLGQSLQLAHQSKQMPDLTVIDASQLGAPVASLVSQGWFQPLELDDAATKRMDTMDLLNGLHIFDGKPYTFPITSPGTNTINWFHTAHLEKAGLDPAAPPTTYDEFRDACKKVKTDGRAGLMLPLKVTGRNASQAGFMAQAAGFAGRSGQLFTTGAYAYDADEYVNYIEFLKSLNDDGLLAPGGATQDVKTAQGQWAAERSTFYWDGPWIPGNIKLNFPQLEGKVGAGPELVAASGHQPLIYQAPAGASYFIPAEAKHADVANKIMGLLTEEDYQVGLCNTMGQLPRDAAAVDKSDAYPIWKEVVASLLERTRKAPSPVVGNPELVKVDEALKPVKPDLGNLIQGYFSGNVSDIRAELKKLTDASNKALEDAVKQASSGGAKVSLDDYAFANWKAGEDYTSQMYDQR